MVSREKNTTCVVYVLQSEAPWVHDSTLAAAQTRALQYSVPIAAVFALEKWDNNLLDKLRQHEVRLRNYNIPLIILVGDRRKVLPGFIFHTKPLAVFDEPIYGIGSAELEAHPHSWPGVVIDIDGLINLQATGKIVC